MLGGFEKFIDLLKASGLQLAAIAGACGIFWLLAAKGMLPYEPPPIVLLGVVLGFLLSLLLALAAIGTAISKPLGRQIKRWRARKDLTKRAEAAIPFMNLNEKAIIAWMLHHNVKIINTELDGGYAASLIGQGFLIAATRPGQVIDVLDVPMKVPDPVWEVWSRHKEKFPYKPNLSTSGYEVDPWRVPY